MVTLQDEYNLFKISNISTGTTRMTALVDYELFASGKFSDERKIKSRKRKSDNSISYAVKFILHQDNVKIFLWGSVVKQLSENETIVLPKLQCITTRTNLWTHYQKGISKDENDNKGSTHIGRPTFFYVCNLIIYLEEILLGSVDYVQVLLLTEPVELL